jgi:uncharacterized protein (TIGR02453 family)
VWFHANRDAYEALIVEPTKAFVADLGDLLRAEVSPGIVFVPKANGSIGPINNDLRFSKDKSPYKDHLLLRFWEGDAKKTAPTLFVRLSADEMGFATGAAFTSVDRWRKLIADDATGEPLADALEVLAEGRDLDVAGAGLKRVPAPYPADHPRADLLRHKGFQARWPEPTPPQVGSGAFVAWCADRLGACADVHRWLVDHL